MKTSNIFKASCLVAVVVLWPSFLASAQSGGGYEITESVVASGGGESSGPGPFIVEGTAGQVFGGDGLSGGTYYVTTGFWNEGSIAPSAANVSITGRVMTADGAGIRNVILTLSGQNGTPQRSISSAFGFFRFDSVEVGASYVLMISAKTYTFAHPTISLQVTDEITDLIFTANPLP